jgi:outer membrane protein OmpA-like peptidoglycan-associated protein
MREITFLGDKTEIYARSKPALDDVIRWLQLNSSVSIAIIGHVNGPDNERSARFYQKASLERAKAVRDYLIENGINEARLDIKGAGNTEMIYADPATDWQNEANRRIEIEIIGL